MVLKRAILGIGLCLILTPATGSASEELQWFASRPLSLSLTASLYSLGHLQASGGPVESKRYGVAGFAATWFPFEHLGLFAGAEVTGRGIHISTTDGTSVYHQTARVLYVEVPAGLALRWRNPWFSDHSFNYVRLGAFHSVPTGHYRAFSREFVRARASWGLYADTGLLFTLTPDFAVSFTLYAKWGLTDAFDANTLGLRSFLEWGPGFGVTMAL